MDVFKAALINEIEKLYKKKKVLVALIISFLTVVFMQIMISFARSGFGIRGMESLSFPVFVLSLVVISIIPLFTALVTIDTFSGEFSHNTMKVALTRPISRFKLFSAKISSIFLYITTNLLIILVFSLISGFIFNPNTEKFVSIFNIILMYLATIVPVMVLALMITLLANIIKSGVGVFFASILIFIVLYVVGFVFSKYSSLFFTSAFDWYKLWTADSIPVGRIFRQFFILIGFGIMLFTSAFYLFDKKEF